MNKEQLAKQLTGCEYGKEISKEVEAEAKAARLVVVFGGSDDLMEFRGAISDEVGACDGGEAFVDGRGLLPERESISDDATLEDYFGRKKTAKKIIAEWCNGDGYCWTFDTAIPHATFEVMEEGKGFCKGIVFSLDELTAEAKAA